MGYDHIILSYCEECKNIATVIHSDCDPCENFIIKVNMLQVDSRKREIDLDRVISNNNALNNEMISEIEKELKHNPYDLISLVFLLYDNADTALRQLLMLQSSTNLTLLHDWFWSSKHKLTWKHELVEALLLCQLYRIVRKLGFHVRSTQNHFQTDNMHIKMYINPVKKALYKICENMNADNLLKLKRSLLTYGIDTSEYDSGEIIFLKLICDKFIILNECLNNKSLFRAQVKLDKLLKIIQSLPGLQELAQDIYALQDSINDGFQPSSPISISTPSPHIKVDECKEDTSTLLFRNDFNDMFSMINNLSLEESTTIKNLKSDKTATRQANDCYVIKDPKRLGVCVILNQVKFYPSKKSMQDAFHTVIPGTRYGSEKDKAVLEITMSKLNFLVYSKTDLNHKQMFHYLETILTEAVSPDDSAFVLCILSHGVKGHIYAADSVKVNIDDFQNLLDSELAIKLHNIPKLIIVQACQDKEVPCPLLVADSPDNNSWKKTNCVICWATVPDMKAFRDLDHGSVFIQVLCDMFLKYAKTEHVCDIFTKVIDTVQDICKKYGYKQWTIYVTSLNKKLYLKKL